MTPAESALLRFPGSVPGVLRLGTPMPDGFVVVSNGVVGIDDAGQEYAMVAHPDREVYPQWVGDIDVELQDATGRAHLAWWLAGSLKHAHTTPEFAVWHMGGVSMQGLDRPERLSVWGLSVAQRPLWSYWPSTHNLFTILDPNDPRLLPDGSRWVDAAALSLVARHMAGIGGGYA